MCRPFSSITCVPLGTATRAPTSAILPSRTSTEPSAISGPDTGCTVAPRSRMVSGPAARRETRVRKMATQVFIGHFGGLACSCLRLVPVSALLLLLRLLLVDQGFLARLL